jgi:arylsulfatase
LIVHWPDQVTRHGELESTPGHLIDLMATAVDVADANYPETFHDGQSIKPMEGKSLLPIFAGRPIEREAIYWEHEGNRAIRVGDMKLVAKGAKGDWELYNIAKDRSEQNDLSGQNPELVKKLSAMWQDYAERADVLPLNPRSKRKN